MDMLYAIDRAQPKLQQLGTYLDAKVMPVSEVRVGDMVYTDTIGDVPEACVVVGFAQCPGCFGNGDMLPYVGRYGEDGHYEKSPNNYLSGKTARIVPKV